MTAATESFLKSMAPAELLRCRADNSPPFLPENRLRVVELGPARDDPPAGYAPRQPLADGDGPLRNPPTSGNEAGRRLVAALQRLCAVRSATCAFQSAAPPPETRRRGNLGSSRAVGLPENRSRSLLLQSWGDTHTIQRE